MDINEYRAIKTMGRHINITPKYLERKRTKRFENFSWVPQRELKGVALF